MNEMLSKLFPVTILKMFATKWEKASWDLYMNARIRNNYQSWLDYSSVQSMEKKFKEMMVNKEVDINGKLDKCSINLLSSIF